MLRDLVGEITVWLYCWRDDLIMAGLECDAGGGKHLFSSGRGLSAVDSSESPSWSSRQTETDRNRSAPSGSEDRGIQRDEWSGGSWRFDGGALTAQRVTSGAKGLGSDSSRNTSIDENGRHRRGADLGLQLDSRRSGTPEGNHEVIHIDDESELLSRTIVGRQTPSPPSNEPNPCSKRDESPPEDDGPLTSLKLGGSSYAYFEDNGAGKRGRSSSPQSQVPTCQVDGCTADLSKGKDYHRRHKVCEMHSKATTALVSRVMKRFCQQCSRFHPLDSFDEGKRSCRRRLAGHNKRRRKTQPDAPGGRMEDQAGVKNVDLATLLGVLSQLKGLRTVFVFPNRSSSMTTSVIDPVDDLVLGMNRSVWVMGAFFCVYEMRCFPNYGNLIHVVHR
jgi:hypothetical protein